MHTHLWFVMLVISVVCGSIPLYAQETVVVGQVLNSLDKTPVPDVNIFFRNSQTGVKSNDEGYFMIRTTRNDAVLVFSSIGYKPREIKIKPGQSVGVNVELHEENTLLKEVFVVPGTNPALDLMRKVRLMKKGNDVTKHSTFTAQSSVQKVILLSRVNERLSNKRLFEQLKKGSLSQSDSMLILPLFMDENKYQIRADERKRLSTNLFSSTRQAEKMTAHLLGEMDNQVNFYDNAITFFDKSFISPLSNAGNIYYDYFLSDSILTDTGKQYQIHYRTKNVKNLAFNGKFRIDSTTLALTAIEAELPLQANLNFIHSLKISQQFDVLQPNRWVPLEDEMALNMTYELLADSLNPRPEIFIKRSVNYAYSDTVNAGVENFASSDYSRETLDARLKALNNTPVFRFATWLADVVFTGYVPVGVIDVGKIQQFVRITDTEGLRLTLPLRTNEKLWKNISLGGYLGYGFKNEELKYSGVAQFRLPTEKRNQISLSYTNDYRRIDYNYNDFMFRENPLVTGDEDISSSVFAFKSAGKINERKELTLTFSSDISQNIENALYLRSTDFVPNADMVMMADNQLFASLHQQSITMATRFSFDERTYDDHMQRIYITNDKPVFYSVLETGKYTLANQTGMYGKVQLSVKQRVNFDIGRLNYIVEGGWLWGSMPYPALFLQSGSETNGYNLYRFNLLNHMEYAADKYVNLHSELTLNGIILNQIPLVKHLNLREVFSFKMAYGGLSNSHRSVLDYPVGLQPLNKPYFEMGAGFTNILRIFSLQSVWRIDPNKPSVRSWGLLGCLQFSF